MHIYLPGNTPGWMRTRLQYTTIAQRLALKLPPILNRAPVRFFNLCRPRGHGLGYGAMMTTFSSFVESVTESGSNSELKKESEGN